MPVIEDLWFGRGAGPRVARAALWPVARAYGLAIAARSRLYDAGLLPARESELPAISVGNLTVGGTGKTPVSAWLAAALARSARPAIVLRGYGADEVEVHRRLNPGIPVVANANRAEAVREARRQGADVAVLDDGFQHRRLERTVDVVLLSIEQLLRAQRLLPAGPWREPLTAARRADLLVLTGKTASVVDTERALGLVHDAAPGVAIAAVRLVPAMLRSATDDLSLPLDRLRGSAVVAVAAIGEPSLFKAQLDELGARVTLAAFRDHHAYTDSEVRELALRVPSDGLAVCTLKDAVKLGLRWPGPSRLWYVSQQLVVDQGEDSLDRFVKRALEARATSVNTAG